MTETNLLEGEITENPKDREIDVEKLLLGFLRALADECVNYEASAPRTSIISAAALAIETPPENTSSQPVPRSATIFRIQPGRRAEALRDGDSL